VKTGQIFQKQVYETNPPYKSLKFGFASPPAWIRQARYESMFLQISYTIPASLEIFQARKSDIYSVFFVPSFILIAVF
jgi:hypothetical protein